MEFNKIFNDDCFNVFKTIPEKSINMVLVDLPYGQTACKWDIQIDLKLMWENLKRIGTDGCQYIFFTTTKYGHKLINSNEKWFRYDLVWEKPNSVGFLSANKMPLRSHEMIYVFNSSNSDDIELNRNLEMREYSKKVKGYINKTLLQINKDFGNSKAEHFYRYKSSQFSLPTVQTYNKLIELYKINEMPGFLKYNQLIFLAYTYNPQKTPGKPYKVNAHKYKPKNIYGEQKGNHKIDVYKQEGVPEHENKTGSRHPLSVIKCHQFDEKLHPTQKPVELCEWLIKTYSNNDDVILDFCMGSATSIIASINTNRRYIGIEKDKDIFKIAEKRINNLQNVD